MYSWSELRKNTVSMFWSNLKIEIFVPNWVLIVKDSFLEHLHFLLCESFLESDKQRSNIRNCYEKNIYIFI